MQIKLQHLKFFAYHGIHEEEKNAGGEYEVNVSVLFVSKRLLITQLSETVDYAALYAVVRHRMEQPTLFLETLATEIATEIIAKFLLAEEVTVAISKLATIDTTIQWLGSSKLHSKKTGMKNIILTALLLLALQSFAQDVNVILKEAVNLERTLKDDEALIKYKTVVAIEPSNMNAIIRCSILSSVIGKRQPDKKAKATWFQQAKGYADKAFSTDSNNADASYAKALAALQMSEAETENKKFAAELKDMKAFTNKALSINPNHGKANYLAGKWSLIVANMPVVKRAALKILYGAIPEATLENAYKFMEKCRTLEPYYVQNFFDLAKAYKNDNKPSKAIEVLNQLVKLPNRTADDAALKAEGKQMLSEMQ